MTSSLKEGIGVNKSCGFQVLFLHTFFWLVFVAFFAFCLFSVICAKRGTLRWKNVALAAKEGRGRIMLLIKNAEKEAILKLTWYNLNYFFCSHRKFYLRRLTPKCLFRFSSVFCLCVVYFGFYFCLGCLTNVIWRFCCLSFLYSLFQSTHIKVIIQSVFG